MARKPTTRKLTRRDAVALLGAGTVMAAVHPAAPAAEAAGAEAQGGGIACDKPGQVGTFGRGNHQALASFSCCEETRNAILVGVGEPKRQPNTRGKGHLKPLRDRLVVDNLEEYCFMIWGLNEQQARDLYTKVPRDMGYEAVKRESGK
jgi:hypothetical protein